MSQTEATTAEDQRIVEITDDALTQILDIRSREDEPDSLRLRIEVTGSRGVDYVYDLSFEVVDDGHDDDLTYEIDGLRVAVPAESAPKLEGSVLDLPGNPMQGGLVLRNPNRPNPLEGADLELTGDLPEKVTQLLEQSINPSLAAHGGFASLVGVEETKVYLAMGGGCQGCSLSAATMVEGITVAMTEALPEVTEVIDVTDHQAGDNPFYT